MHDREVPVTELGAFGPRRLVVPLDDGSGRFGQQAPQSRVGLGFGVGHVVNDLTRAPASFDMAIEVVVVDDFGVVQEMRGGFSKPRAGRRCFCSWFFGAFCGRISSITCGSSGRSIPSMVMAGPCRGCVCI